MNRQRRRIVSHVFSTAHDPSGSCHRPSLHHNTTDVIPGAMARNMFSMISIPVRHVTTPSTIYLVSISPPPPWSGSALSLTFQHQWWISLTRNALARNSSDSPLPVLSHADSPLATAQGFLNMQCCEYLPRFFPSMGFDAYSSRSTATVLTSLNPFFSNTFTPPGVSLRCAHIAAPLSAAHATALATRADATPEFCQFGSTSIPQQYMVGRVG